MTKIGIYGSNGRMGKELALHLQYENDAKVALLCGRDGNLQELFEKSEVIIDFSSPLGTKRLLQAAQNAPKPLVIGTTGLDESLTQSLKDSAKLMPIFYATNMSLGIAVLNHLATKASAMLKDFDIEILEMHHRHKKDAPSGTAMTLAQSVAEARNADLKKIRVSARDGMIGERSKDEIAVMSLRGGDIVGRHTVGFYEDGEFLELCHTATSRATFAKGAIKIAQWLCKKERGFYSINDFLGI